MPWVKIDDHIDEHPKIAQIDNDAFALYVCGLAYCNRNLTDGNIPKSVGLGKLRYCGGGVKEAIEQLVAANLWEPTPTGWKIHDYPDYQPSKEQVLAEREAGKKRAAHSYAQKLSRHSSGEEIAKNGRIFGDSSGDTRIPYSDSLIPVSEPATNVKDSATAPRKKPRGNGSPPESAEVWSAFQQAYRDRYGCDHPRNATVNGQMVQFIGRIGLEEAPLVAAFYVQHPNAYYVQKRHTVGIMLHDAETLRTDWATGKRSTRRAATEEDRLAATGDMWRDIKEELCAKPINRLD